MNIEYSDANLDGVSCYAPRLYGVCVCVCVRARDGEREKERRERKIACGSSGHDKQHNTKLNQAEEIMMCHLEM
jgi:hypothetical protein